MASGLLGRRIKELRQKKQVTQEELGKSVGVTTQAVSKWECGGVPDVELLPAIADYFGVTIDNLFGRTDELKQNLELAIRYELTNLPMEERYEKSFRYCWSIILGLIGHESRYLTQDITDLLKEDKNQLYSRILTNEGMISTKLCDNCHYFFLMPEGNIDLGTNLAKEEEYQLLFQTLAKTNIIKLLLYLYHRKNDGFTVPFICKNLKLTENEVEEMLNELSKLEIVEKQEIETEDGIISSYRLLENSAIVPFLLFAKEFMQQPQMMYPIMHGRTKPLL